MADPYVYPYTNVLKNKLSLKDKDVLDEMEADYTELRIRELREQPLKGNFDFQHFCAVHAYIFQDVYEWAGRPRTIPVEKEERVLGGLSVEYAKPDEIVHGAEEVLKRMNSRDWNSMSFDERVNAFSKDMADLWKVHAFREGNTRTAIVFCCDFAESRGFLLDRALLKDNCSFLRDSLVAANAVFSDLGDLSKPEHLHRIIKDGMQRGAEMAQESSAMSMDAWQTQIAQERRRGASSAQEREDNHRSTQGRGDR